MAEWNNKNKLIAMKFSTRRFSRLLMLKLRMQKYRTIPVWSNNRIFTLILRYFFSEFDLKIVINFFK